MPADDLCVWLKIIFGTIVGTFITLYIGIHSNVISNLTYYAVDANRWINQFRFDKDYPSANNESIHVLFSSFRNQIIAPDYEIPNIEMEKEISQIIDRSLQFRGIYLLYGENGIGKSIALQKILRNRTSIHYVYVENGGGELVDILVPNFNKDSKYTDYQMIKRTLIQYSDYRKTQNLNRTFG